MPTSSRRSLAEGERKRNRNSRFLPDEFTRAPNPQSAFFPQFWRQDDVKTRIADAIHNPALISRRLDPLQLSQPLFH